VSAGDLLAGFGVLVSAVTGLLYFFSQRFREKKKRDWQDHLPSEKITEWGAWLLGIAVLLTVICAIIITFAAR
jgi:energy-converting hydrogenase Eha subunit G